MGALLARGALLLGALPAQQSKDAVKRNRGHSTGPLVHLIPQPCFVGNGALNTELSRILFSNFDNV